MKENDRTRLYEGSVGAEVRCHVMASWHCLRLALLPKAEWQRTSRRQLLVVCRVNLVRGWQRLFSGRRREPFRCFEVKLTADDTAFQRETERAVRLMYRAWAATVVPSVPFVMRKTES